MSLTREQILAGIARPSIEVEVPEFGGTVFFREMSVRERAEFHDRVFGDKKDKKAQGQNYALSLIAGTVCDAAGERLFSVEDVSLLFEGSDTKLAPLVRHAERINGLGAKATEDAEKNSEPTPSSGSDSG